MTKMRNAFDVLGKPPKAKKKLERSEFVAGEAEESDEDTGFGFGLSKKEDEEDEDDDGEDQDQVMAELVDDKAMDEETLAEAAVVEKHRQQMEEMDKDNEKLHKDAVTGKLRIKRRDRGVGLDSSDSEDDDERARELRAKRKKMNLNNDSIAALAKNQDTQAFAKEYTASMDDDEDEFAHLRREGMEVDGGEDAKEEDSNDERPVVSAAELEKEMRLVARKNDYTEFDVHNVGYLDQEDEEMEEPRVREVSNAVLGSHRQSAGSSAERTGDAVPQSWARWAKTETSSRTAGVVGRNTGGAAVTGHGKKAGAGSGSFKASRTAAASFSASAKSAKLAKAPSVLSTVSSRRGKFGHKV
ncbi:MRC1-like domain-containing protein [Daedaleopsis nitida]|nr:MRC1-like domain-containing protein [Daedaleopsis nitida]